MAIDKINTDISSRITSQEKVREATSGKKNNITSSEPEIKKAQLDDTKPAFSEDARRLQETEVILQNALLKLHEMDEVNQQNIAGIQSKIDKSFYDNDAVADKVLDDIFPEQQLRASVEKRVKAEKYVSLLTEIDNQQTDNAKLDEIRAKIENGFYDTDAVVDSITDTLINLIDI
jgi:anti-sigma28 factor (negative regulator of flagellin synthesis)